MLINTKTKTRVWEHEFKAGYPNTSFPTVLTDAVVADFGHAVLVYPIQPTAPLGQKVIDNGHALIDGQWQVQWAIVGKTAEEAASDASAARASRDAKLASTDWTQVADTPADKASWAVYRQALRDVTEQPGFPWEIVWPLMP